jgi:hypothetical protein
MKVTNVNITGGYEKQKRNPLKHTAQIAAFGIVTTLYQMN